MASTPKTFDPGQVVVSLFGILCGGFADGTFVEVSRDEDAFSKSVGADGEVARVRNRNRAGSIKLTLMQSSATNKLLAAKALLDEAGGEGYGAVLIKDLSGSSLVSSEQAWIKKVPDSAFGKELGTREWVIDCAALELTVGGN